MPQNDPLSLFDFEKARAAGYSEKRIEQFKRGEIPNISGDVKDFIRPQAGLRSQDPLNLLPSEPEESTATLPQNVKAKDPLNIFPKPEEEFLRATGSPKEAAAELGGLQQPDIDPVNLLIDLAAGGVTASRTAMPVIKGAVMRAIAGMQVRTTVEATRKVTDSEIAAQLSPFVLMALTQAATVGLDKVNTDYGGLRNFIKAKLGETIVVPKGSGLGSKAVVAERATDEILKAVGGETALIRAKDPLSLLASERGSIPLEPLHTAVEVGKSALTELDKLFTRFVGLNPQWQQKMINYQEMDGISREHSAQRSVDLFKDFSDEQNRALHEHLEDPRNKPLPEGTGALKTQLIELRQTHFKEINRPFMPEKDFERFEKAVDENQPIPKDINLKVPKWPDTFINDLTFRKENLEAKLRTTHMNRDAELRQLEDRMAGEAAVEKISTKWQIRMDKYEAEIDAIDDRLEKLHGLEYFHRITESSVKSKLVSRGRARTISATPKKFLGRKYATIEEAEEAGKKVRSLPAAVAEMLYETERVQRTQQLIKDILEDPNLSAKATKAPADWVAMDERILPDQGNMYLRHILRYRSQGRRFHPAIADALKEITYVQDPHALTRAYDRLNWVGKFIGFYNPIFMVRNNTSQGIRASGFTYLADIPQAIRHWRAQDDLYLKLRKNGVFNKANNYQPAIADITEQLRDTVAKADLPADAKEIALKTLNPVNLWKWMNEFTWKADEVQRIATYLRLSRNPRIVRHYSDFQIMELTNDFHANYDKLPKRTKEILNRMVFTPTYKTSMARIVGRMHQEPKSLWPSLLRHYAMKIMFNKFLPMAATAYYVYKKTDKKARVDGYRLIVSEPGTNEETVYSITDPVLEMTKVLNRPYNRTFEFNMASVPTAIVNVLRGPLYQSDDPDWVETTNSFFKTGAPVLKELQDWRKDDKETWQKFMQSFGFAFIYKRNRQPELRRPALQQAMQAMDLWLDRKKFIGMHDEKTLMSLAIDAAPGVTKKARTAEVRKYMQSEYGEKNFRRISYAARREVYDHFKLTTQEYSAKYVR